MASLWPIAAPLDGHCENRLGRQGLSMWLSDCEKNRIAYVVSHPIQYQAPLLRLLSVQPGIELTVFFQSDLSVRAYHDAGFGHSLEWDVPLVHGYHYEVLPAVGRRDTLGRIRPLTYGIAARLWGGRFDFLWVHGCARWFNWVAMSAARMASIPVFVRDEATAISTPRPPTKIQLKRLVFFRALGKICDAFLAIGSLNRRFYLENGISPDRVFLMPYCVDNEYFAGLAKTAAPHRQELRARLGLAPERPIILYASKMERRKRADDLLGAFAKLISQHTGGKRPYLLFAGDGEMRRELEGKARGVAEDVRFLGFRNQSELPSFYDLCDVFVLPSEHEPWGLVVNEAMSVGRAVIVSDQVGCWPDLVRNGVNGYVYPVGDIDALSEALGTVLRNRAASAAMGQASSDIIAGWTFQDDLDGLRAAMTATTNRRTVERTQ